MRSLFVLFLSLCIFSCNNSPENPSAKVQSFADVLQPGQKDSIQIIGTDTAHFTGTPRTVYDWVLTSITSKDDTTPIPPLKPVAFSVDTIPFSDPDILAPMRGGNTFYMSKQDIALIPGNPQALDNYTRYNWGLFQTGQTTYNFSQLDKDFNTCIDKGQAFNFRIVTMATSNPGTQSIDGAMLGYPLFLHQQMQQENPKDWVPSGSGMWRPNENSNSFLTAWEGFLKALSDHINTSSYKNVAYKNVLRKKDIDGFGNYGEWHNAGSGRGQEPSEYKATGATLQRIVQASITAFPNIPLIGNVDMFYDENDGQLGYFVLTTSNNWGKIGFGNDHLGDNNTWKSEVTNQRSYNGLKFYPEYLNRWQYAPMLGEPINSSSTAKANGNCEFWDFENEVRQLRVSSFNNQNGTGVNSTCLQNNYIASAKASGYRLQVNGGIYSSAKGILQLTLNWSNIGIAPVYENWITTLELRSGATVIWSGKSSFNPKLFLPGKLTVTDLFTGIPSGSYSLYVILKDPTGYRKPLATANKNVGKDGAYLLTTIN